MPIVAIEGSRIVGGVIIVDQTRPIRAIAKDAEAEFRLLGVDPAARGAGVGEPLVRECIDRARGSGATAVVIYTQTTMIQAQRLYERLGTIGVHARAARDFVSQSGRQMLVYRL